MYSFHCKSCERWKYRSVWNFNSMNDSFCTLEIFSRNFFQKCKHYHRYVSFVIFCIISTKCNYSDCSVYMLYKMRWLASRFCIIEPCRRKYSVCVPFLSSCIYVLKVGLFFESSFVKATEKWKPIAHQISCKNGTGNNDRCIIFRHNFNNYLPWQLVLIELAW